MDLEHTQSARVAARKLREAKLHAEEAKAFLEKENLEKEHDVQKGKKPRSNFMAKKYGMGNSKQGINIETK